MPDANTAHGADTEDAEAEIDCGSIVEYGDPYTPKDGGTYTHGIVTSIVSHVRGPNSPPRNVGTIPYNPRDGTIFIRNRDTGDSIPQIVDFNIKAENLTHIAKPPGAQRIASQVLDEDYLQTLPQDDRAAADRLAPILDTFEEYEVIENTRVLAPLTGDGVTTASIFVHTDHENEPLLMDAIRNAGWEVTDTAPSESDNTERRFLKPSNRETE